MGRPSTKHVPLVVGPCPTDFRMSQTWAVPWSLGPSCWAVPFFGPSMCFICLSHSGWGLFFFFSLDVWLVLNAFYNAIMLSMFIHICGFNILL
jgi:hypothetical protein